MGFFEGIGFSVMMLVGRFIKMAVMMGLVSQLLMSAYMTSMILQRQSLESAQNSFYTAVSTLGKKANKDFSLCLNGDSSGESYQDCLICKALIGFGAYTLAALPISVPKQGKPQAVRPVSLAIIAQDFSRSGYIRGPPAIA